MDEKKLVWKEEGRKRVFTNKIFSVWESYCTTPQTVAAGKSSAAGAAPAAETRTFSVIDAMDWAIIVPVIESPMGAPLGGKFLMVWQWRPGTKSLSLEFPGGVFESGEEPLEAAARELREETGYTPGKIKKIGEFSPNPAIMSNRVHFFLAEDLTDTGRQSLDEDEYVEAELVDIDKVSRGIGEPPFIHALMGSALSLYFKERQKNEAARF